MDKWKLIVTLGVLVVVLAGATLLYNSISAGNIPELDLRSGSLEEQQSGRRETEGSGAEGQGGSENDGAEADSEGGGTGDESDGQADRLLAPDFTAYDKDGNAVSLSDFIGKPVILNFWASWCGPCKLEMPHFDQAYKDHGDEIAFLMVNLTDNMQETQSKAEDFISSNGYSFPVYFDLDMDGAYTYGVSSIPATVVIDAEGYVEGAVTGMLTEDQVSQIIEILKP